MLPGGDKSSVIFLGVVLGGTYYEVCYFGSIVFYAFESVFPIKSQIMVTLYERRLHVSQLLQHSCSLSFKCLLNVI